MEQFLAQSREYFEQWGKAGDHQCEAKKQPDQRSVPAPVAGSLSADRDDGRLRR